MARERPTLETTLEKTIFWALHQWHPVHGFYEWEQIEGAKILAEKIASRFDIQLKPEAQASLRDLELAGLAEAGLERVRLAEAERSKASEACARCGKTPCMREGECES